MAPAMRNAVREDSRPAPLVWVVEGAGEVLLGLPLLPLEDGAWVDAEVGAPEAPVTAALLLLVSTAHN